MNTEKWIKIQFTWYNMKKRCLNPEDYAWKWYGGRGIRICNRWLDENIIRVEGHRKRIKIGFINFYDDMESTWFPGSTLDRLDNDNDYTPENCRWITREENLYEMNQRRLDNGTHHFLGITNPSHKRIADGTHHFQGGEIQRKSVANGTHHLQGKGMMTALDITTGEFHRITKEEYWKGKGVKYLVPNSKITRYMVKIYE